MSEIKLTEQPTDSEITGVVPDLDESNSSFNRLSFVLQNSGQKFYFQLNKEDSADLIIKKGDELYVEEDNVNYLKDAYCINEYEKRIHFAFRSAVENIDVPSEWTNEIQGVPKSAARATLPPLGQTPSPPYLLASPPARLHASLWMFSREG